MEDKTFELLKKMYEDLKGELTDIKETLNKKADKTDIIRLENDHGKKLDALFDGYKQSCGKLEVLEDKIDDLSNKVDRHDIKIQVIEGGRK